MKNSKILKALLYPPAAVRVLLIPISVVFLVFSLVKLTPESPIAIISYVLSAYTLTVWCMKIPDIIKFFKNFKNENKYARLWIENPHLRVLVTLYGSLALNMVFALFQLGLGIYHKSFWFYSLAGYYVMLAGIRYYLVRYTSKKTEKTDLKTELLKYRAAGIVFLFINLALSVIMLFMIKFGRTFVHHEITTIMIAAYTFTALTIAIVGLVKFRKYKSPVYSASKAVSLAAALVSVLTLEATMLTTFGGETITDSVRKLFLSISGGMISAFIVAMSLYMIISATGELKKQEEKKDTAND